MIAFIHLGKTAGSTFKNVLRRSFGHHHCDAVAMDSDRVFRDKDLALAKSVYFGLWSLCSHHFQDPVHTLTEPLDYVTFVRDPVQRAASHYQHMVRDLEQGRRSNIPDLEEWIWGSARNFQITQLTGSDNIRAATDILQDHFLFIGLTEEFGTSLQIFAQLSPWPVNTLSERRNVAPATNIKKKLTEDSGIRKMLEEANSVDMEFYSHIRETLFPAQHATAEQLLIETGEHLTPDRYRASRIFTNLVYRPAVKLARQFS
jgi:hypothetical protein